MAKKFMRGMNSTPVNVPAILPHPQKNGYDEFLILLLLFILLAASPSLGLDGSYFFIIIMTVIGLGGVGKAFGLNR